MRGSRIPSTTFASCAFVTALLLGGCASQPEWNVPPHQARPPAEQIKPFRTDGDWVNCYDPTYAKRDPACMPKEKREAIKRYEAAYSNDG